MLLWSNIFKNQGVSRHEKITFGFHCLTLYLFYMISNTGNNYVLVNVLGAHWLNLLDRYARFISVLFHSLDNAESPPWCFYLPRIILLLAVQLPCHRGWADVRASTDSVNSPIVTLFFPTLRGWRLKVFSFRSSEMRQRVELTMDIIRINDNYSR